MVQAGRKTIKRFWLNGFNILIKLRATLLVFKHCEATGTWEACWKYWFLNPGSQRFCTRKLGRARIVVGGQGEACRNIVSRATSVNNNAGDSQTLFYLISLSLLFHAIVILAPVCDHRNFCFWFETLYIQNQPEPSALLLSQTPILSVFLHRSIHVCLYLFYIQKRVTIYYIILWVFYFPHTNKS